MLRTGPAVGFRRRRSPPDTVERRNRVQRTLRHVGKERETGSLSHSEKTILALGVTLPWAIGMGRSDNVRAPHFVLLTNLRTTCSMRDHRFAIRRRHGERHNWKR